MARTGIVLFVSLVAVSIAGTVQAEGTGSAVVRVATVPQVGQGLFRFTGIPAGELTLAGGPSTSLTASGLEPGSHVSTLDYLDPTITAAGYRLTEIRCDDAGSAEPSTGNVQQREATFRIEEDETVTCVFSFSMQRPAEGEGEGGQPAIPGGGGSAGSGGGADSPTEEGEEPGGAATPAGTPCTCPKEGRWNVDNHPGQMVCTGPVALTKRLKASRQSGTLEIQDDCSTIVAEGLSEDEATLVMHAVDGCGFAGSVGGSEGGIPMVIEFTWEVHDDERITGELHSTVSQQGMTCEMSRDYELNYSP